MSGFPQDAAGVRLSRRQGLGCIGLGAFALGGAVLCLVLGIRCAGKHDTFDCIGLLTVFPIAFAAVGLTSLAVGLQRFTAAGSEAHAATAPPGLGSGWQAARIVPSRPARMAPPAVIHLSAAAPGTAQEVANEGDETP